MSDSQEQYCVNAEERLPQQSGDSSRAKKNPARRSRNIHPGEALGIYPNLRPHPNRNSVRYQKGDIDVDSIVAFLSHLRENDELPKEILRVRGKIRNAFPGVGCTKSMIREAYEKAGWNMNEICWKTKKEKKGGPGYQIKPTSKKHRDMPIC